MALTAQVTQLGKTYTETSNHTAIFSPGDYLSGSTQAQAAVPQAPTIALQSINALSPHDVVFTYNVTGAPLYSLSLQYGSIHQIWTGSSPAEFYLDQSTYPAGDNAAVMTGYLYGVAVNTPWCYINVADNISVSGTSSSTVLVGGDPPAGQYVSVSHIGADVVATTVDYCIPPTNGSLTTQIGAASGSIDTRNNSSNAESDIFAIGETHNYAGGVDTLAPVSSPGWPSQGPQFQTRELSYPNLWVPANTVASICNVLMLFGTSAGTWAVPPRGCVPLALP